MPDRPEHAGGTGSSATTLRTAERGLALLRAVADAEDGATAKSLSRALDLKIGTCYHLLRTLRANGYLERLPDGTWTIGPQAAALGRQLSQRIGVAPELAAILTRLHTRTGETSYICGWKHGAITVQEYIVGRQQLRVDGLEAGVAGAMHARASCRAILAYLPREILTTLFAELPLTRLTAHTIVDLDRLLDELAAITQQGYAIDREEFTDGVCCVAAPFFGSEGQPVGAFAVSAPTSRFDANLARLSAGVREAAIMATQTIRDGRIPEPPAPFAPGPQERRPWGTVA